MPAAPLVVSYGGGVDSTAVIVGLRRLCIRPAMIIFADVGCERPETYAYMRLFSEYLARVGFPPITVVRYSHGEALYATLFDECIVNRSLPGLAWGAGRKTCSLKWKRDPIHAHLAKVFGANTYLFIAIGYDNGDKDGRRVEKADRLPATGHFRNWYPLRDWGWDRGRCFAEIASERLEVPIKSSCFFCPAQKPGEVRWLVRSHPELADMIALMETNAKPFIEIDGLWRGKRKDGRPGAIGEFVRMIREGRDDPRILDATEEVLTTNVLHGGDLEDPCQV